MATNLAGNVAIGQLNACVLRAARLDSDCTPTGGANSGIVTGGLVTLTADPEIEAGTVFEPKTGCGNIGYTYRQEDRIKRYNLSGELLFFDYELMEVLFGGTLILGKAGGTYAGKVIGYADRAFSAAARNNTYLEVIVQNITADAGDCAQVVGGNTAYTGYIFGKARLTLGSRVFANEEARVTFTGTSDGNPYLYNGPWNDYPGAGYIPGTSMVQVGYSAAEYAAILATITPGYAANLPAGS